MGFSEESDAALILACQALPHLVAEFGPEERARSIVLKDLAERKVIICFHCKSENEIPSAELRMFLCKKCRKEIWVTARTNYHKAQLFFPRLAIIRFFEMGISLNPNQAAELLRISNDTANRIYKQVGISVISKFPENAVEVPSAAALSIFSRRTNQTPAQKPPFEEEFEMQRKNQEQNSQAISESTSLPGMPELSELELLILEILSDISVGFDQLSVQTLQNSSSLTSALTLLELRGLVLSQPGNRFIKAKSMPINVDFDEGKKSLVESFNFFVKDHYQGIGRKNSQIYSSFFWLAYDRKTWQKNSLRKLFTAHPYISYQDILDFVTPLTFKIVSCFNTS